MEITHELIPPVVQRPADVSRYQAEYTTGDGTRWDVSVGYTSGQVSAAPTYSFRRSDIPGFHGCHASGDLTPLLGDDFAMWLTGFLDKARQMEVARLKELALVFDPPAEPPR